MKIYRSLLKFGVSASAILSVVWLAFSISSEKHRGRSEEVLVAKSGENRRGDGRLRDFGLGRSANDRPAEEVPKHYVQRFSLLRNGELSFAARRDLGLSDEQCRKVNHVVGSMKSKIEAEMISRMKRDSLFDRPNIRGEAYSIDAFPSIKEDLVSRAISDLGEIVSHDVSMQIVSEIEQSSMFLGAGANDVLLIVNPEVIDGAVDATGSPAEAWHVGYSLLDPETGRRKAGGVIDFSKFNSDFMNLFEASPEISSDSQGQ